MDISPKLSIKTAEKELETPLGTIEMGQNIGGVSAFSTAFKRGYGSNVFGVDDNGLWLGAADYDDGTFRVSMAGSMYAQSDDGAMTWDNENNRILIAVSGVDQILIGVF